MASMILVWDFSPKPSNAATRPSLHAASSFSMESTPSSSWSFFTFLGPTPWRSSISMRPGGSDAFSVSW